MFELHKINLHPVLEVFVVLLGNDTVTVVTVSLASLPATSGSLRPAEELAMADRRARQPRTAAAARWE